ncbi:hypothetical protein L211DRAFT_837774, partial [Terfezia boudieri ATCC MYA-4762]
AATTTNSQLPRQPLKDKGKSAATPHPSTQNPPNKKGMELVHPDHIAQIATPPTNRKTQVRTQAVVLHAAPTKYKPGLMRRWIEEDNKNAQIKGIRWLLLEGRRVGKAVSSLLIYLAEEIDIKNGLRMGKRLFRTTTYNWDT